jgi:hypothetical protein
MNQPKFDKMRNLVAGVSVVEATWALDGLLLGDWDNVDWDRVELMKLSVDFLVGY